MFRASETETRLEGPVLVTGATGFIGLHCVLQLLEADLTSDDGWAEAVEGCEVRRAACNAP